MAASGIGPLLANVAGSLVSTVIANELHRQLTFHAAERVDWFTTQREGGGLALAGLRCWAPGLGEVAQASAVIAGTTVIGGMRFLVLRSFVFREAGSGGLRLQCSAGVDKLGRPGDES